MKTINFLNYECHVIKRQYPNKRWALELIDAHDGMRITIATVNIPEFPLQDDTVLIKAWSENQGIDKVLVDAGIIGPEKGRVETGFVTASVHKLLNLE